MLNTELNLHAVLCALLEDERLVLEGGQFSYGLARDMPSLAYAPGSEASITISGRPLTSRPNVVMMTCVLAQRNKTRPTLPFLGHWTLQHQRCANPTMPSICSRIRHERRGFEVRLQFSCHRHGILGNEQLARRRRQQHTSGLQVRRDKEVSLLTCVGAKSSSSVIKSQPSSVDECTYDLPWFVVLLLWVFVATLNWCTN